MAVFRPVDWPARPWGGFDELDRMRRDMDRLLAGVTGWPSKETVAGVFPLTNVTEDDHNYYVRAELPGMAADEIDISVTGDSLSISGERQIRAQKEEAKYHRREREAGKFSRIIGLPGLIDTEKVEASLENGILSIAISKAEIAKPKQISISS